MVTNIPLVIPCGGGDSCVSSENEVASTFNSNSNDNSCINTTPNNVNVNTNSDNNNNGDPGPSLLPVGLPFLPTIGSDTSHFYTGHPGPSFNMKENMKAWRSIPPYAASMFGGYDSAILAGYPMLRNGYGMDLNSSRRKNATRETTSTLKHWLNEHRKNPYPTKAEKIMLAIITQMTLTQVSTWFANARRRLKKENKMTWSPRNRCDDDEDEDEVEVDVDSKESNAYNINSFTTSNINNQQSINNQQPPNKPRIWSIVELATSE